MDTDEESEKLNEEPTGADSLADYFAEHITSSYNQHVMVRIVGSAGTGKSWGGVFLAMEVAKRVAEIKGGKPEDYFCFENDLAVMGKDEIKRVMTNPGEYHILMLDDVGVGMNARKYASDYNIEINNTLQTFRPNHNLVIMTMQAGFLVDKVPRTIAHYEIEMESANFREGITVAKVNRIVYKHKLDKIFFPYIFLNGTRYVRHIFESPPKELMERYEAERAKQLKRLNEKPQENGNGNRKIDKTDLYFDIWAKLRQDGYSYREIGCMTHTDHAHIATTLKQRGVVV